MLDDAPAHDLPRPQGSGWLANRGGCAPFPVATWFEAMQRNGYVHRDAMLTPFCLKCDPFKLTGGKYDIVFYRIIGSPHDT